MKVCWLSAGVSSFIAGYLAKDVDKFIYIDIADQHPDSLRFVHDCENVLNQPIEILKNKTYNCVEVLHYYATDHKPHFQHEGYNGLTVTHWMPLPELPKEADK